MTATVSAALSFGRTASRIFPATLLSLTLVSSSCSPSGSTVLTQFEAHLALAQYFTPSGEVELTPEQLRTLRSLGYIR